MPAEPPRDLIIFGGFFMSTRASSVDHRKRIKKYRLFGAIVLLFLTYTPALFAADAILTWNRNAETTVTGYKIYYGTAPKQYTNSIDAGNQITYTVTGLSNLTYYFAVTAYDALKNESNYSNEVSKAFTGTADTIPPLISGISVGSITSGGARITWSTDEPSSTQVEYGVITAYGSTAPLDATLTTAHGQTLTALLPGMRYHYRVLSRDAAGNLAVSPDGAFTTAMVPDTAAPAAPANLTAMPTASTQIDLAWSDSTDNAGVAGYRIYRNGVQVGTSGLPGYSDKELAPSTLYTYTVSAYDAAGNVSNQSIAAGATTLLPGTITTVVLRPLADTFLNLDRLVYHTEQTLNTYTWPNHQVANAILMKFDLTGIPKGAIVQSATLNLALVQSDASADAGYTVTAHKVINQNPDLTRATGSSYNGVNNWTASTCCYNQTPLAQADLSLPYATTGVDKVLGFKTWTITAMINEWVNQGVVNRGLLLNSDTTKLADRFRTFASMQHTDAALRPYLSVTYQLPNTPDTMAPVAQWVGPLSGSMVRGSVSVQANLSDNISVVQAAFFVDGARKALQQGTDLKSVSWSWDTTGLTDGTHRLFVQAFDAAHLTGNSQEISVTVDNTPPTAPGAPSTTAILQNQISLTWSPSTDGIFLMGYGIFRDGAALATTQGASFTDSGLAPNRSYSYAIVAVDAARNKSATSAAFSVKTLPLAPVVGIPAASTLTSNSGHPLRFGRSFRRLHFGLVRIRRHHDLRDRHSAGHLHHFDDPLNARDLSFGRDPPSLQTGRSECRREELWAGPSPDDFAGCSSPSGHGLHADFGSLSLGDGFRSPRSGRRRQLQGDLTPFSISLLRPDLQ